MKTTLSAEPTEFSVVLPCFNEAENIVDLVDEIIAQMEAIPELAVRYEVIVVDDCSQDDTSRALKARFSPDNASVRVIRHRENYGQSAAICTGIDASRHAWIITLDGDGQNDPADIANLITRANSIYTTHRHPMICGRRVKRQDTWVRKMSSKVANSVRARLLGDATPDTGCGLKLFSKEAFLKFPRFNHMHRFLPALAQRDGGHVESVSVNHRPRLHGVSKYGLHNRLWVGLVDLCGVMWLQRRKFRGFRHKEL